MGWIRIFLLLFIVSIEKVIGNNMRSITMSIMNEQRLLCANTTCLPSVICTVSTIRACQIECLANDQCQAASFYPTNFNCTLFYNVFNQTNYMSFQTNVISMIVISQARILSG